METVLSYPLLCTRGAVVFPLQDMTIEVGRTVSITHNTDIVLVSQIDLTVDQPGIADIYTVGTICRIKNSRTRDDHLRVIFTGLKRCRILRAYEKEGVNHVDVMPLDEIIDNDLEIQSLTKRAIKEFNTIAAKYSKAGFAVFTLRH